MLIQLFDPWKSKLCTCPKKYSFSPYTGCSHACIYCYITSYIRDPFHARLKKDLFKMLKKEVKRIDKKLNKISKELEKQKNSLMLKMLFLGALLLLSLYMLYLYKKFYVPELVEYDKL